VRWEDEIDRVWEAMTSHPERFEAAPDAAAAPPPASEETLPLGG
jgi:hypothetical protein